MPLNQCFTKILVVISLYTLSIPSLYAGGGFSFLKKPGLSQGDLKQTKNYTQALFTIYIPLASLELAIFKFKNLSQLEDYDDTLRDILLELGLGDRDIDCLSSQDYDLSKSEETPSLKKLSGYMEVIPAQAAEDMIHKLVDLPLLGYSSRLLTVFEESFQNPLAYYEDTKAVKTEIAQWVRKEVIKYSLVIEKQLKQGKQIESAHDVKELYEQIHLEAGPMIKKNFDKKFTKNKIYKLNFKLSTHRFHNFLLKGMSDYCLCINSLYNLPDYEPSKDWSPRYEGQQVFVKSFYQLRDILPGFREFLLNYP